MKTLKLLHSLRAKELREFGSVIKNHKRDSLKKLFQHLKRHRESSQKPDHKALFEAVFSQSYLPQKDYLLRNELRLLNAALTEFLAQKEFQEACRENKHVLQHWYLKSLARRNQPDLFSTEYKRVYQQATQALQYDIAAELGGLYRGILIRKKEMSQERLREVHALSDTTLRLLQKEFVRKIRAHEVLRAYSERTMQLLDPEYPFSPEMAAVNLHEPQHNDAYSHFLSLYARSFRENGAPKIATLNAALAYLSECIHPGMQTANPKTFVLATIALEHYLLGQFEQADRYYQQWQAHCADTQQKPGLEILFNCFINKVNLLDYRGAIAMFEAHAEAIVRNEKVHYRFSSVKCMCHLMLGENAAALRAVPHNIQQRPDAEYHSFRFVLVIAYFQSGDPEAGLRECRNLLKVINYRGTPAAGIDMKAIAKLFSRFLSHQDEPAYLNSDRAGQLRTEVEAISQSPDPRTRDFLPLKWLKNQLTPQN